MEYIIRQDYKPTNLRTTSEQLRVTILYLETHALLKSQIIHTTPIYSVMFVLPPKKVIGEASNISNVINKIESENVNDCCLMI